MQYEKQLLDVILSHSHYSFELGKGRDIKYDYKSIEAHLVRKFVVEKPLLDLSQRNSIPLVVFKGDIFTKEMVHKITKAVSPQVFIYVSVCVNMCLCTYHRWLMLSLTIPSFQMLFV